MPYEIFARESCLETYDALVLSKEYLHDLSCKNEDDDDVHVVSVDAGVIRILLHFKRCLLEKDSHSDDGSFRFTSVTIND